MAFEKHGIDILLEDSSLSEEGRDKVKVMFEAAVSEAVAKRKEELEEEFKENLQEKVQSTLDEMEKTIDEAITYVAEEWMKENELAVDIGIKTELVESFLSGLKGLFEDHYVEIPEDKVDVVEEMAQLVQEKESEVDSAVAKALALEEEIKSLKKAAIISEVTKDMVETDIERYKSLIEGVDYIDDESFTKKANVVKETYFNEEKDDKKKKGEGEEDRDGEGEEVKKSKVNESMADYVSAIASKRKF